MAIFGTYKDTTGTYNNICAKITRLWGSKLENWNAWVAILKNATDTEPITTFHLLAEYVEGENPYTVLYKKLSTMDCFSNVTSDDVQYVEKNKTENEEVQTKDVKPEKRTRKRK